jgi:crotonobetaine/carnitine-CoA ligase
VSELHDGSTIGAIFASAVSSHGDCPFFAVPPNERRDYLPAGFEISYREAGRRVAELSAAYRDAGYGPGQRIATLLENRPEYVLHKLALNAIGVCCVPINPDYRASEIAYLLEHSEPDLVLTLAAREGQMSSALAQSAHRPPMLQLNFAAGALVKASRPARRGEARA